MPEPASEKYLQGLVDAILEVKPSMHGEHGPAPGTCRFCEGEAYGLAKVRALINNWLATDG